MGPEPKPYCCTRCGTTDEDDFYKSTKQKSKCKKCHTMEVHQNKRELKVRAVQYLGGKCSDCGAEFNPWVFDFHHRDPTEKEWSWGDVRTSNWEKIKEEIDKCDLLCSNCHRTRHHIEWVDSLPENHIFFESAEYKNMEV